MSGRRAREVRIRRGQLAAWHEYRRRFEAEWRRQHPLGMWVDYGTVSDALVTAYPWLAGWAPRDAFQAYVTHYSNTIAVPRLRAEVEAMFGAARAPGTKTHLMAPKLDTSVYRVLDAVD